MKPQLDAVAEHVKELRKIDATLDPQTGTSTQRRRRFRRLGARLSASLEPSRQHMGKTMTAFAPGLFAGWDDADLPTDNLALERAFRLPKGHERRIHGRAHAGVRIVYRGPSLLLVLDAHTRHPAPFSTDDLAPWSGAQPPVSQRECQRRRRIMKKARSAKKRPLLLADLERRYRCAILAP